MATRFRLIKNEEGETLAWLLQDGMSYDVVPTREMAKLASEAPGIYDEEFKLVEAQTPPWKRSSR